MMKRCAAPRAIQRLVTTRFPHRITTSTRYLSSASCVVENDDIPDYFDILGLKRSFNVDTRDLKKSYKALMSKLHPDLHRNKTEEEQDALHDEASQVTQAYRILNNPQHRALHLLELMGKPLNETATASLLGPDFLMNVMEIREAIDVASGQNQVKALMDDVEQEISATSLQLANAFENDDLETALKLTAELQYWNRCLETLREKPCFGCWD